MSKARSVVWLDRREELTLTALATLLPLVTLVSVSL